MRPWTLERALSSKTCGSRWCVGADFDGKDYGQEYLTLSTGDTLEQWQTCPDGWAFGRILHGNQTRLSGQNVIGWYPKLFVNASLTEHSAA